MKKLSIWEYGFHNKWNLFNFHHDLTINDTIKKNNAIMEVLLLFGVNIMRFIINKLIRFVITSSLEHALFLLTKYITISETPSHYSDYLTRTWYQNSKQTFICHFYSPKQDARNIGNTKSTHWRCSSACGSWHRF